MLQKYKSNAVSTNKTNASIKQGIWVISAWVDVAQVVLSSRENNTFHLSIGPYLLSMFHCVFLGIAGAEELLLVESNCVRIAVKPNLQAEEGLAGEN